VICLTCHTQGSISPNMQQQRNKTKTTTIATIKPQSYRNTAGTTWQQTETLISHDSSMLKNGLLDQFEAIFLNWTRFFLLQKSRDKRILWTVKQTDLPDFPQTRFNQSKCSRKQKKPTTIATIIKSESCKNTAATTPYFHQMPSILVSSSLLLHTESDLPATKLDTPINNPSRKKALQRVLKQSCEALFSSQMIRLAYTLIMFKLINLR
jgi:hypothetical protein